MVTSDLDALPVLDVVSIEWPDEDVPCNAKVPGGCSVGAVWWHECPGCGDMAYACEPHRAAHDAAAAEGRRFRCSQCKTSRPKKMPWRPLR